MKNNLVLKIFVGICLSLIMFTSFGNVYAKVYTDIFDAVLGGGSNFFDPDNAGTRGEDEIGGVINKEIDNLGLIDAALKVGNLIFVIITAVLGVKYIFAGSAAKADIKNSLITLCFAIVFFFLARTVWSFANGSLTDLFGGAADYDTIAGKIWRTISFVINICAILGIVLIGLRYMLASANTRADIKNELIPVAVGIVLVYATVNVINFILSVSNAALT